MVVFPVSGSSSFPALIATICELEFSCGLAGRTHNKTASAANKKVRIFIDSPPRSIRKSLLRLLLVDLSFLHYKFHVFEQPDVLERVTRNGDDVRIFSGLQGTEQVRFAEQIGGIAGGGLDGLHRRHAVFDHERKLAGIDAVGADARVCAERHLYARANGFREVPPVK